ncbi:unnamed protein product [Linum trigynum]|uniref:RNase H type-1 domain-containing protein n=1 Tax=Linum trigynum TaxID=586398 RepID=A0AAV2EGR6_9ROSI
MWNQIEMPFVKEGAVLGGESRRVRHLVSWQRPSARWVSLNTDGSVIRASGVAAPGGVIRDSDDRFIQAFAANLGGGSITQAELAGIAYGLRIMWDAGCQKVVVQSDYVTEVNLILSAPAHHPHFTMVSSIRNWIGRD